MKKTDLLKDYYTKIKDVPRIKLTAELETVRGYIRSTEGNISRMESDLESYRAESAEYEAQEKLIGKRIEALPVVEPMKGSMVGKDLAKALALPFVSSIAMNGTDIIFTTKPNTLKTKLVKKLDGPERVEVEPYYIFLPSYRIRVGMDRVYETLANTENAPSIALSLAGQINPLHIER